MQDFSDNRALLEGPSLENAHLVGYSLLCPLVRGNNTPTNNLTCSLALTHVYGGLGRLMTLRTRSQKSPVHFAKLKDPCAPAETQAGRPVMQSLWSRD